MKNSITSICYEINKECDLACDYCITSDNPIDRISYEKIVLFLKRLNPKRIVISGGEPLLDAFLLDKLELIRKGLPNAYISLSTNGTISYDYSELEGLIDCIDVSLPTLDPKIYKGMRGYDKLSKVINNLEKVKDCDYDLRLSFMLTKYNYTGLKDVMDYANKLNVVEFRVGRYFPFRGGHVFKDKYELTDNEIKNIVEEIKDEDYHYKIVRPISSLKIMESGYLTVNYAGEVSVPTEKGKNILLTIESGLEDINKINSLSNNQNKIFKKVILKDTPKK